MAEDEVVGWPEKLDTRIPDGLILRRDTRIGQIVVAGDRQRDDEGNIVARVIPHNLTC